MWYAVAHRYVRPAGGLAGWPAAGAGTDARTSAAAATAGRASLMAVSSAGRREWGRAGAIVGTTPRSRKRLPRSTGESAVPFLSSGTESPPPTRTPDDPTTPPRRGDAA